MAIAPVQAKPHNHSSHVTCVKSSLDLLVLHIHTNSCGNTIFQTGTLFQAHPLSLFLTLALAVVLQQTAAGIPILKTQDLNFVANLFSQEQSFGSIILQT